MALFVHATGICDDEYGLSYDCDMWLNTENIFSIGEHESGNIVATVRSVGIYIIDGQTAEVDDAVKQIFTKKSKSESKREGAECYGTKSND